MAQTVRNSSARDFPGGPVVKTLPSIAGIAGSIPGQGAKISHAFWPKYIYIFVYIYIYIYKTEAIF